MANPGLGLNRQQLAQFLKDHNSIRTFEQLQNSVTSETPDAIEQASISAATAGAAANSALDQLTELEDVQNRLEAAVTMLNSAFDMLADVNSTLSMLEGATRAQLGSIAPQNHDNVDITGGRVGLSAGTVGLPAMYIVDATTGFYRIGANNWGFAIGGFKRIDISNGIFELPSMTLLTDTTIESTVATGDGPPFLIASTAKVDNLYVNKADILANPTSFPAAATDLPTVITLANALRTAGIAKGL